ncbi:3,9-dihydroxypterocarpan 6A-monooxygenase-like [Tripterygium wilfordii]|uniref:3,9-dihydroxypterocarpan 6A-monooxygenase-like n=1 Tax=Tripterygium wilfordii TaxID=458696 RepID=UPI0018F80B9D|nr:3,9-dihydroxypterocarpan 6A-monooxygenase-like [Tripterygium wilfordii]
MKPFSKQSNMADIQEFTIPVIAFLASIILVQLIARNRHKTRLPPSPTSLPIIGHMHHLGPIPHQAFHKLSLKYGPLIYFFIGSKPSLLASSPELAKEILKTHESNFMSRPKVANLDYLTYGSADFATIPYGPYWKFMKKLCMTELLGTRTLEQFLPIRRREINRFLNFLLKKAATGEAVNVGGELMRLTNNIISSMLLRTRCSDMESDADEVRKMVKELNELGAKFNFSDSFWFCKHIDLQGFGKRLKEARDKYDAMIERVIKEHEEERKKDVKDRGDVVKDLLDILLDIYEDESAEIRLTRENVKAFIMNIFGAGTDTSSITVEWGLAELINHPQVMEKARIEINSIVGESRIVEESDIPNLPYLQAIVKEVLRLHPTGPLIVRESSEDCTIGDYNIPAKTRVFVNVWSLGRDPNYWKDPLEFKPERFMGQEWIGKSNMLDVRGQHFHMLPFGAGRRSCPGASLALQFVPTTLAAMIQCFDWKVSDGENGFVDMEEGPGLTLPRANSLVCVPVPRFNPFPSI